MIYLYEEDKMTIKKSALSLSLATLLLVSCTSDPSLESVITKSDIFVSTDMDTTSYHQQELELLSDNSFENGFALKSTTTKDGSLVVKNLDYEGKVKGSPNWQMAQWWTPYDFKDAPYSYVNNRHIYENESRKLAVDCSKKELEMDLDSWIEYQKLFNTSRSKSSQNWSHFLIEENFDQIVYLTECSSLRLKLNFQIDEVTMFDKENYDPSMHAAQFVLYLTVRNERLNKFFWFGLPLYDNRGEGSDFSYNIDTGFEGATNTLIYKIGRKDFLADPLPILGKRYSLDIDLLSYIQDAIVFGMTDKSIGKPFEDWNVDDLYINYMNFGWELPGSFKVRSTFDNLSIKAEVYRE